MIWEQDVDWDNNASITENTFIGGYEDLLGHFEQNEVSDGEDE